ncbi:MAG: hypothetical protein AB1649_31845 [Chloroflexota bacterium]
MDVPAIDHPAWKDIVTGKAKYQLDFLAAKILLGWLMLKVKSDPSPSMIETCGQALHNLFAQNPDLPCVQHDLEQIFGGDVQ